MSAGYSGTPLVKKLGIKPGYTVLIVGAPTHYEELLGPLPRNVRKVPLSYDEPVDFIHLFAANSTELYKHLPGLKRKLSRDGLLWVSWIKKASQLETDISESDIRIMGLGVGLVDVKICAVDENWSGLKFVYRKEDR